MEATKVADDKLAVSINEAAAMIGLKRDLTYRLILGGDIRSFKVGSRRLVSVEALRVYISRRTAEDQRVEVES